MESCYYCREQYHPMPVYELAALEKYRKAGLFWYSEDNPDLDKPLRIHVCHFKLDGIMLLDSGCPKKAQADGYSYRPALTRKR